MSEKRPHLRLPPEMGDGASYNVLPHDVSEAMIGEIVIQWMSDVYESANPEPAKLSVVMLTSEEFDALPECG